MDSNDISEIASEGLCFNLDDDNPHSFELTVEDQIRYKKWKGRFDLNILKENDPKWGYFMTKKHLLGCIESMLNKKSFILSKSEGNYLFTFFLTSEIMEEEEKLEFCLMLKEVLNETLEEKITQLNKNIKEVEKLREDQNSEIKVIIQQMKESQENQNKIFLNSFSYLEKRLNDFIKREDFEFELKEFNSFLLSEYCQKEKFFEMSKKIDQLITEKENVLQVLFEIVNKQITNTDMDKQKDLNIDLKNEMIFLDPNNDTYILENLNKTIQLESENVDRRWVRINTQIPCKRKFSVKIKIENTKNGCIFFGLMPTSFNENNEYLAEKCYLLSFKDCYLYYNGEPIFKGKNPNFTSGDTVIIDLDLDQKTISYIKDSPNLDLQENKFLFTDIEILDLLLFIDLTDRGDKITLLD
jgi:hypothetical protein